MKTILDTILEQKKSEIKALRKEYSYKDFEASPLFSRSAISLKKKLANESFGIIAEIKRKSPSAGTINANIDVTQQGKLYAASNVAGISCLTDNLFFGGTMSDLTSLRENVNVPILRKDFIIDELQLFEAKAAGADVILLIAEALSTEEALHLTIMAQQLGMEVLMECHDRENLKKINDQVDIIGVNNRNLHLQKTDLTTSHALYDFLPEDIPCISESGIRTRSELLHLASIGFKGALIGESILKQEDPKQFITSLSPKTMNYVS